MDASLANACPVTEIVLVMMRTNLAVIANHVQLIIAMDEEHARLIRQRKKSASKFGLKIRNHLG